MDEQELGVTVAEETPLTEVAKIRLELAAVDEAYQNLHDIKSAQEFKRVSIILEQDLDAKLHILLDTIDMQQRQIDELLKVVAGVQS